MNKKENLNHKGIERSQGTKNTKEEKKRWKKLFLIFVYFGAPRGAPYPAGEIPASIICRSD